MLYSEKALTYGDWTWLEIEYLIREEVKSVNEAFRNSGIENLTLNLVRMQQVSDVMSRDTDTLSVVAPAFALGTGQCPWVYGKQVVA